MNTPFWNILIPALSGLAGVFLGSLKPLIDWNIEQRRLRRADRIEFIKRLREMATNENFRVSGEHLLYTVEYSRFRAYCSKEFIDYFENFKGEIVGTKVRVHDFTWFLDEIQRLERKWELL